MSMGRISALVELARKTIKFGPYITLGNVVLTHGRNILPENVIKMLARSRNEKIQKRLLPLVKNTIKEYSNQGISYSKDWNNTIWICWLQGEENMPPIISLCLHNIRRYANGHEVKVITQANFAEYVEIDPVILKKYDEGIIKNCHFADILRICLLAQKGGLWMDATLLCTSPIDSAFFEKDFYTIKLVPYGNFVSQCRWSVYCLSAKSGNKLFVLLEKLFSVYLEENDYFIDYFLFDQFIDMLYNNDPEIKSMIDNVEQSNLGIQNLNPILLKSYDRTIWENLTCDTSIFKLSWKSYSERQIKEAGDNTYYSCILKEII